MRLSLCAAIVPGPPNTARCGCGHYAATMDFLQLPGSSTRRCASAVSSMSSPRPGAVGRRNKPSTGRGGFEKTACMRGDGSFNSQGLTARSFVAARWRLAMWPIVGCVWCGTNSAPCAWASAAQRSMPVMPPILTMSSCPSARRRGSGRHHGRGVALLAGGNGDRELPRDLAHRAHVVVLHRFLEPPVSQLLEDAPHAHRAARRVAVVGVERERKIVTDELAHGARLGEAIRNLAVEIHAVVVEADLDRRRLITQTRLDDAQHLVHAARRAVAADRRVEGQRGAPRAA